MLHELWLQNGGGEGEGEGEQEGGGGFGVRWVTSEPPTSGVVK